MKLSTLRLDPALCDRGVWVGYLGDVRLRIARAGNPQYEEAVRRIAAQRLGASAEDPDEAFWEGVAREATAETILLGWENVTDDDGAPIEYTPARALALFADPCFREFYRFVTFESTRASRYRARALEVAAGNSQAPSSGTSASAPTKLNSKG